MAKIKGVSSPRSHEEELAEISAYMVEQIAKKFRNQVLNALQVGTINKFADKQIGNYANVFTGLAGQAKRKALKQFDNSRINEATTKILNKVNKRSQKEFYKRIENKVVINTTDLIKKEGMKPTTNALIIETALWVQKVRDETIQYFTNNTLRAMTLGYGIDDIMKQFDEMEETRKNHAKFVARNQVQNFNSLTTNVRAKNLGITKAIWQTAGDERVRPSHVDREGKEFDLKEGCYSSIDGLWLQAGTAPNCRCTVSYLLPDEEEEE